MATFTAPAWVLDYAVLAAAFVALALIATLFGWPRRRGTAGKLALNAAAAFALLGALEFIAFAKAQPRSEHRPAGYAKAYVLPDDDLGYCAKPGAQSDAALWVGDTEIYDVTYRFDANGCRRLPDRSGTPPTGTLLCFGGSFMFGEGLHEDETVPAQLELALKELQHDALRPVPLALHGWSAHQMLSLLQSQKLESMELPSPKAAVYWAIADHVRRTNGMRSWDQEGPYFEVTAPGVAERRGRFSDLPGHPLIDPKSQGWSTVSWAMRRTHTSEPGVEKAHVDRWAAVVATAARELSSRYPGAKLHVLIDDMRDPIVKPMVTALLALGIEPLLVSDALDGYDVDKSPWVLHPRDSHPTARAAERIAGHLARSLHESL